MRCKKTSERRKRKRIVERKIKAVKDISPIEQQSERQGRAIEQHNKTVIHAPRLNKTYRIGSDVFLSGKSHRPGGSYGCKHAVKVRHKHKDKQINLRSITAHLRVDDPDLYALTR